MTAEPAWFASIIQHLDTIMQSSMFGALIVFLLIGVATLASEDLTCISAGVLVAYGKFNFVFAAAACAMGIIVGDIGIYWAGRLLGRPVVRRAPFKWFISRDKIRKSEIWAKKKGKQVVVVSRFLPGSRVATYFTCGLLKMPAWVFIAYLTIAVLLWVPLLVWVSMLFGANVTDYFTRFQYYPFLLIIGLMLGWRIVEKVLAVFLNYRSRRLALATLYRVRSWEFWPLWLFYMPVFFKIIRLGIKYRSISLFSLANPGIDAGGFVGESKYDILQKLGLGYPHVAKSAFIAPNTGKHKMFDQVAQFMAENNLNFPIVAKPDRGERGKGVLILNTDQQLHRMVHKSTHGLIIQEYVSGPEFSVFYYRFPNESKGHIYSVTVKKMPVVTGDGDRTLEQLILDDPDLLPMGRKYLNKNEFQSLRVPDKGEIVQLTNIGTHSLGSKFYDGAHLITEALQDKIEQISAAFPGFYFGRYDIKAPSFDAFKNADGLKVLELNGVTSESTNIYDPKFTLKAAYQTLFRQWEIAFEIGQLNASKSRQPVGALGLIKRLFYSFD